MNRILWFVLALMLFSNRTLAVDVKMVISVPGHQSIIQIAKDVGTKVYDDAGMTVWVKGVKKNVAVVSGKVLWKKGPIGDCFSSRPFTEFTAILNGLKQKVPPGVSWSVSEIGGDKVTIYCKQ